MIISKNKKGTLIVIVGPSGCGKGTIINSLLEKQKDIFLSISATTRSPRVGEVDGVNYYFIAQDKFENMVKNDEMLEHAVYVEYCYGTPKAPVLEHINNGENVILEIDLQGAMQIKKNFPLAVLIFISPPSIEELRNRLINRNTDSMSVIEKRIKRAEVELNHKNDFDHIIVNNTVEQATNEVLDIINKIR